jgi:hypothetical protein
VRRRLSFLTLLALTVTGCSRALAPSPPPGPATVDVLTFLIGNDDLWPRFGRHLQQQVVDLAKQEVCWVKYGNPRAFECWRWDDRFVYHAVDHALDGGSRESYSFTDGRWLPRYLPRAATAASPWTLDVARNRQVWFDAACHVVAARSYLFPYRMRAWIVSSVDAGPDLGVRDTLVFEYQPYDPAASAPGASERYSFGLNAGWYRWERGGIVDRFERVGGRATTMDASVRCPMQDAAR